MASEYSHHVGIIGAGGWGSALSILLARNSRQVLLWSREKGVVEEIAARRTNETFLPGVVFPPGVTPTVDLEQVADSSTFLILAVPSQFMRSVAVRLRPYVRPQHVILHASKGLEQSTALRMSVVLAQELPHEVHGRIAVISGPSHAEEVARDIPTAVVAASESPEIACMAQELLMSPTFRVYTCHDVVGVELGGALKNIIAIAAGLSDGLGFGDNTKAALMTRGLAEIARLGVKMGASPMTFSGLSGLGDLIVTCTSMHSRNRRAGIELGRGKTLSEVLSSSPMVVEGVPTTRAACELSTRYGVNMPITRKLEAVLFEGYDPRRAVSDLMLRDPAHEPEFNVGGIA